MAYFGRAPFFGLEMLTRVFRSCLDAVETDDIEGVVLYVNDTWCALFGFSRSEAEGRKWDDVLPARSNSGELSDTWDHCVFHEGSKGVLRFINAAGGDVADSYSRTLYRNSEGAATAVITIYRPTA